MTRDELRAKMVRWTNFDFSGPSDRISVAELVIELIDEVKSFHARCPICGGKDLHDSIHGWTCAENGHEFLNPIYIKQ